MTTRNASPLPIARARPLQLANFWQDVKRDFRIGRVYVPLDVMSHHGYSFETLEVDLQQGRASANFRAVMKELVGRTQDLFDAGMRLAHKVDRRLAVDLDLFSRGGMAILKKIRQQGFDTIARRPKLLTRDRLLLLVQAVAHNVLHRPRAAQGAQHAYR